MLREAFSEVGAQLRDAYIPTDRVTVRLPTTNCANPRCTAHRCTPRRTCTASFGCAFDPATAGGTDGTAR
eukprot:SAG11_NODE_187_length_13061_cov_10.715322_7_plen_70_part_00